MTLNLTPQRSDPRFAQLRAIKRELQALDELEAERPGLVEKLAALRAEMRDEPSNVSRSGFEPQRASACLDPYCDGSEPGAIRIVGAGPSIRPAA